MKALISNSRNEKRIKRMRARTLERAVNTAFLCCCKMRVVGRYREGQSNTCVWLLLLLLMLLLLS